MAGEHEDMIWLPAAGKTATASLTNGNGSNELKVEGEADNETEWRLQSELTSVLNEIQWHQLIESSSIKAAARLSHCSMSDAAVWLTVLPIEERLKLCDDEVRSALRHQFGLGVSSRSVYCKCSSVLDAGHAHRCNRVHCAATTDRHNEIVAELRELSQEICHIRAQVEPELTVAGPSDGVNRKLKLDLLMCGVDGFRLGIDVTFIYGESDSYLPNVDPDMAGDGFAVKSVNRSVRELFKASAARQSEKMGTYGAECKRRDIDFCAFVMESHGFMHESVNGVLQRMAEYSVRMFGGDTGPIVGYMKRRIAIAAQRGNARLDRSAIGSSVGSYGSRIARGLIAPPRSE